MTAVVLAVVFGFHALCASTLATFQVPGPGETLWIVVLAYVGAFEAPLSVVEGIRLGEFESGAGTYKPVDGMPVPSRRYWLAPLTTCHDNWTEPSPIFRAVKPVGAGRVEIAEDGSMAAEGIVTLQLTCRLCGNSLPPFLNCQVQFAVPLALAVCIGIRLPGTMMVPEPVTFALLATSSIAGNGHSVAVNAMFV